MFHSFHYDQDNWRVQKIKQMGAGEGERLLTANQWEDVKAGGNSATTERIDEQKVGKSCTIVLIGSHTAGQEWVEYEIARLGTKRGVYRGSRSIG